jgi:hypothetical protein
MSWLPIFPSRYTRAGRRIISEVAQGTVSNWRFCVVYGPSKHDLWSVRVDIVASLKRPGKKYATARMLEWHWPGDHFANWGTDCSAWYESHTALFVAGSQQASFSVSNGSWTSCSGSNLVELERNPYQVCFRIKVKTGISSKQVEK